MNGFQNATNKKEVIDFLSSVPDKNIMPYLKFQYCMNQAIEQYKKELFTYSGSTRALLLTSEVSGIFAEFTNISLT